MGLIRWEKMRFHVIPPMPKKITSIAVTLFFDSGNWVHMEFNIGTEPNANIDPGMMIEKMVKV